MEAAKKPGSKVPLPATPAVQRTKTTSNPKRKRSRRTKKLLVNAIILILALVIGCLIGRYAIQRSGKHSPIIPEQVAILSQELYCYIPKLEAGVTVKHNDDWLLVEKADPMRMAVERPVPLSLKLLPHGDLDNCAAASEQGVKVAEMRLLKGETTIVAQKVKMEEERVAGRAIAAVDPVTKETRHCCVLGHQIKQVVE